MWRGQHAPHRSPKFALAWIDQLSADMRDGSCRPEVRRWRIRVLLYAGKPDWSRFALVAP